MPAPEFNLSVSGSAPDQYATEAGLENEVNRVLAAVWGGLEANGGKSFASRAAAVSYGQANLPSALGVIYTREGSALVFRVASQSTDDPLFATSPYWGATARIDAAAAMRDAGLITLANIAGTADAITAELPAAAKQNGVTGTSGTSIIEIVPIVTNTGAAEPTLSIDGGTAALIRSETGTALSAGQLVSGRSYLLRRRGSQWRIITGVAMSDLLSSEARAGILPMSSVGGTANAVTASLPAGSSVVAGLRAMLTPVAANTGSVTLAVSGGAASQVRTAGDAQLAPGELAAGRPVIIQRDGTVWRVIADFTPPSYVDGQVASLRADLSVATDDVAALRTDMDAPFESVSGAEFVALDTDAGGRAIRIMRDDGQDMLMSRDFWERGRDILLQSPSGGLSKTAIQIISESGQSLSVGGSWVAGMSYEIAMSTTEPGAALMLSGLQHSDGGEVRLDGARARSYNFAVHATGIAQAVPTPSILTGIFPLASMLNQHRADAGLPEVPVLATCHGIAGVAIEDMDDDPATGTGATTIWDNMSFWYDEAKATAAAAGKSLSVPYHDWLHGTSASTAPAGQYLARLWDFQRDFRALLAAKGIPGAAIMVMGQPAGASNTSNGAVGWHCRDEVLQFCEAGGGILTTAEHWYEISDNNVHPDALATALMQETRAWALASVEAGHRWTIHRPSISTAGGVMTLDFASLHEDEYLVAEAAKYGGQGIDAYLGFELVGGVITASEVRGRQVVLTYTGTPTQVRYAYQQQDATVFVDNCYVAPRGVLRTSKTKLSKMVAGGVLVRAIPAFRINL